MTREERIAAIEECAARLIKTDLDLAVAANQRHAAEEALIRIIEEATGGGFRQRLVTDLMGIDHPPGDGPSVAVAGPITRARAHMTTVEIDAAEVGRRVRMLRTVLGLTQTEAASRAGMAQSELARLEKGGRTKRPTTGPAFTVVYRLLQAWGVTPEQAIAYLMPELRRDTPA